jgi:hypothetical protein
MEKQVQGWLTGFTKQPKRENELTEIQCKIEYLREQEARKKNNFAEYMERFPTIRAVQIHEARLEAIRKEIEAGR